MRLTPTIRPVRKPVIGLVQALRRWRANSMDCPLRALELIGSNHRGTVQLKRQTAGRTQER
jgi:hypothetical protein